MPKTVLGQPINEAKWSKAKEQAAKQGHAGEYRYIMTIYKQMAHLNKSINKLIIVLKPSQLA